MARGIEANLQDKFINLLKRESIEYKKQTGGLSYLPYGKPEKIIIKDRTFYKGIFQPILNTKGFADVIVFTSEIYKLHTPLGAKEEQFIKLGKTYFIEIKTDTGELRDSQIEKFNKLKELGFPCLILRPKHWEKAKLKGKLTFENVLSEMEEY